MSYEIKFMSLNKAELEYEVSIRGDTPAATVQELRKQISKSCLHFPSEDILVSPLDPSTDLLGAGDVLKKVCDTLSGSADKSALLRSQNLLNHLYHRLRRITPSEALKTEYEDCIREYKDIRAMLEKLLPSAIDMLALPLSDLQTSTGSVLPQQTINVTCESNNTNLFSKIRYDGKTCVRAFLQRVEEFRLAKNVNSDKILRNASEFLQGDALHWFRGVRDSLSSWDDLAEKLKADFSHTDYDYRLLTEIRSRTQGDRENIIIYLSIMTSYFQRLSKPLTEEDKLEIILHNIRPRYASALASANPIKTIDQLRTICRNYDDIQSRTASFHEPPKVTADTIAPDLSYSTSSTSKQNNTYKFNTYNPRFKHNQTFRPNTFNKLEGSVSNNHINAVQSTSKQINKQFCPRCRTTDHSLKSCKQDRFPICFKCGKLNVKYSNCPDCQAMIKPGTPKQPKN